MATFNGSEGGPIPLSTAMEWTANYRKTIKEGETRAHYFGRETYQKLLDEAGSVGIRAYYAIDDKGKKQLLLVGVDENGNDILPSENSASKDGDGSGEVMDKSFPCPTYCSDPSIL